MIEDRNQQQLLESPKQEHQPEGRQQFNNYLEYFVSTLGFCVGYGSIWRFPYLIFKNGGGCFLIPYFILVITVGIPVFYLETAIGQVFKAGSPKIFESINKKFKGIGICSALISLIMGTYYNLILALSYYYLKESFKYPLPWTIDQSKTDVIWNTQYFYKDILQITDDISSIGNVVWYIAICYILSQLVCFICVHKGIQVSGRIAIFTALCPYFLILVFLIRGLFLEGAGKGLAFLFLPDYNKLLEPQIWVDAGAQVMFQMSIGVSVLIFMGSYRGMKEEIFKTSLRLTSLICLCGFLGAIAVFTVMGYVSEKLNIDIKDIPLSGPELSFVVYPTALTLLPLSNLWSILFYIIMILLGIDTQFGFLDVLSGWIEDEFRDLATGKIIIYGYNVGKPIVRFAVSLFICIFFIIYCTQGGFYYFGFVDQQVCGIPLLSIILIQTWFFNYYKDFSYIEKKIKYIANQDTPSIIKMSLKYITPFITAFILLLCIYDQITYVFTQIWWVTILGWIIIFIPIAPIIYYYQKYKNNDENDAPIVQYELKEAIN